MRHPSSWLNPGEVAVMARVHRTTVVKWAKTGRLPFVRTYSGRHRFRLADVRAFLRENRHCEATPARRYANTIAVGDTFLNQLSPKLTKRWPYVDPIEQEVASHG